MAELEKAARNYLLNEHISPINDILHKCDLKVEMQYHTDIENAFKAGANWQYEQMIDKACEWLKEWAYFSVNEFTGSLDEEDLIERFRVAMKED